MQKVIGILTKDFRLYHDLTRSMREKKLRVIGLSFDSPIPPEVSVIITSPSEIDEVDFEKKIACVDVEDAIRKALQMLKGERIHTLVVGVDPGEKPGVAIIGNGEVIDRFSASSPEAVSKLLGRALRAYSFKKPRVRIGHGDILNRNRIINSLLSSGYDVEMVDERGTTRRTEEPDLDAAVDIALSTGKAVKERLGIAPTSGQLKDIQRRSRRESEGKITISKALALEVAKGKMSLAEAIDVQRKSIKHG